VFQGVEQDQTGKIRYTEFLAATAAVRTVLEERQLKQLFAKLDADSTGFTSVENISSILRTGMYVFNLKVCVFFLGQVQHTRSTLLPPRPHLSSNSTPHALLTDVFTTSYYMI
jgi:hypothetical protein